MLSLTAKGESAGARAGMLRLRNDLTLVEQWYAGKRFWAVKDPVSLRYFHLRDEEYAILKMLDGRTGVTEIKRRFERRFAPSQLRMHSLQSFLSRVHRDGLVVSDTTGQAQQLHGRRRQKNLHRLAMFWTQVLAIRFRGFDPERLLDWLYPKMRWMFHPASVVAATLFAAGALLLVTVQWDVLQSRLPGFTSFFSVQNAFWLAVAIGAVKVLHELGHALACKHFGGECHEMGLMLLVFAPCLYCNVSDSWLLKSRWKRIAIAAAGMAVEVVIASVCTFLWWTSEPGLLNTICLNTMFVCSFGTLLINGNPLLRYDGYYILSDLLEVPNLAQRSRAVVRGALARWCLGIEGVDEPAVPEGRRGLLAVYAVASVVYRWVVLFAILWFLYHLLQPHGLAVVAQSITAMVVLAMILSPLMGLFRFLRNPLWSRRIHRVRAIGSTVVVLGVLAIVMMVPLPNRIEAPVVVEPVDAQRLYVSVPGTLLEAVAAGERVESGDTVALLENLDVALETQQLVGQRDQQALHVKHLETQRVFDPEAAAQLPAASQALHDLQQRLGQRQKDQARLRLIAPTAGVVMPPPIRTASVKPGELTHWQGTPIEPANRGAHLKTGSLVCLIGDPAQLEAILTIDQGDIQFVGVGQSVRIALDLLGGDVLDGVITEIAENDRQNISHEEDEQESAAEDYATSYQARVKLAPHTRQLPLGSRGRAKISAQSQTLGDRLLRYLSKTFRFTDA